MLKQHGWLEVTGIVSVDVKSIRERPYQGVDRSPWDVLDEHWYANKLPSDIRATFAKMRDRDRRSVWWPFALHGDNPQRLLEYERAFTSERSLIAFRSSYLISLGAPVFLVRGISLGFDVVAPGAWSLLRELHESAPELAGKFSGMVNENGLLVRREDVEATIPIYMAATKAGLVEAIAFDPRLPVESVEVVKLDP